MVLLLFSFKVLYPDSVHLSRGNHETLNMNRIYGFEGEVKAKYNATMFQLFTEVFHCLPLCHVLAKKVSGGVDIALCSHQAHPALAPLPSRPLPPTLDEPRPSTTHP